jgi:hypothetical protein
MLSLNFNILFLILLLINLIFSQTVKNKKEYNPEIYSDSNSDSNYDDSLTTIEEEQADICNDKLFNPDSILSQIQAEKICVILRTEYPNFIIRIRTHRETIVKGNVFYEQTSAKFFDTQCENFEKMCHMGFLIDIYVDDEIVIIQPGLKAKKLANDIYRNRVIETVRSNLIASQWDLAIEKSIKLLAYKVNGGKVKYPQPVSDEPSNFFWKILLPSLAAMFIILTVVLYYLSKGIVNKDLFNYFDQILTYWEEIEKSKDKRIVLEPHICIFCWKATSNKNEIFLYCNHSYHERCMKKWLLYDFKSCPCSYEPIANELAEADDNSRPPYLMVPDLKILLGLSLDSFRKENMYDYFVENEKKTSQFGEKYDINLEELCWLYQNKLSTYKSYRIFYKMYKTLKLMCFILAFAPSFLKSKKAKLITKLINVKQKGATVGRFK